MPDELPYIEELTEPWRIPLPTQTARTVFCCVADDVAEAFSLSVTSWIDATQKIADLESRDTLSLALHLFFAHSGRQACIVLAPNWAAAMAQVGTLAFDLLCLPTVPGDALPDAEVHQTATQICENKKAIYIADAPVEWMSAADPVAIALEEAPSLFGFSKNVALYFPRLSVRAPDGSARASFPASPLVAGIMANVDAQRGIWKAPANETLAGVIAVMPDLDDAQNALLNPQGINCIRQFEGRGIRIWGARTRAGAIGGNPEFRYINVVRLIHHIEIALDEGLKAVVFEPNTPLLWAKVRLCVSDMLRLLWRNGALQGAKPEHGFFIHCGLGTTMTQQDVDNRQLLVTIGIAPVRPAEFIVLQFASSTA